MNKQQPQCNYSSKSGSDFAKATHILGLFLSVSLTLFILAACSSRIEAPKYLSDSLSSTPTTNYGQEEITKLDLEAEDAIAKGCVEAWRKAIGGDETKAMAQLKAPDKQYPKVATIHFMIGQVLERFGKKKEAIPYYQDSVDQFEFSSIHLFKLAETMRTTGDAKGSLVPYRKLVQTAPEFMPGKMGLAKALLVLDPNSAEAKAELKQVLKSEPDNKEASSLLTRI
jgi:tetratricopeptide (TPR) repeat protein